MKFFSACSLFLAATALSGCAHLNTSTSMEKFALTNEPQEAVFMIGTGWTGGMGSMPVFDWGTDTVKRYENYPVYFDESYRAAVQEKLPECFAGTPQIVVSANITLKKLSDTNDSIEDAPVQTYYQAKVNQLRGIDVKAEPCE